MTARQLLRLTGVGTVAAWTLLAAPTALPTAAAAQCPDVQIVFARGTFAPPGVGGIGQDFVDAVRSKVGGKSVDVYPVVYPASTDFPTAVDGIRDAANHIEDMTTRCPNTKLVLGGYSQGAAVIGFTTANVVPHGVDPSDVPQPMPADVAKHVAAVALLGKPKTEFMDAIKEPPITVGPLYSAKTIELCAPGDPICSNGDDSSAHTSYTRIGMTDQAAAYVAGRV